MNRTSRSSAWSHPDGRLATVASLRRVFVAHIGALSTSGDVYSSRNMQVGIDCERLLFHEPLLCDMLDLDPRGALFSQSTCAEAVLQAFEETRQDAQLCADDHVQIVAYMIRVTAAHVRLSHDNTTKPGDHQLARLFSKIKLLASAKRMRRDERLQSRPHPFITFRTHPTSGGDVEVEEEEDEEEHETPSVVSTLFDPSSRKGLMLLSDGSTQHADSYIAGQNGFIVCQWHMPATCYETEMANVFLQGVLYSTTFLAS